ncbi:NACHT and WD repeat domain-containing protein 2 isoform X3 [Lycorma delicatula]|uniref:NACHT and WD repeat domain-containing protein 2 isoform X3 n=1 Tax=Lycorma delicatula TaxID=130591 RepID=UPI003F51068E
MGSSCSSRQAHKDKDSASQRSEESPSYQVTKGTKIDGAEPSTASTGVASGIVLKVEQSGSQPIVPVNTIGSSSTTGTSSSSTTATTVTTSRHVPNPPHRGVAVSSFSTDSVSPGSPPPGSILSPKEIDKSLLPPTVKKLNSNIQHLLVGAIAAAKTNVKTRKIVLYVSAADSQDCCVEKGILHNNVYPVLRQESLERGYELHIIDLHWRTSLEKQQDHEFPELCIEQLNRQSEVAYTVPVLFLSNSLGTPLLPKTVETQDFEMVLSQAGNRSLLEQWYHHDSHAQPPCYRLQPITRNIPGFKEGQPEEREKALGIWRSEIDRLLSVLLAAFSEELRDSYLTTVVEQEVHNTVMMSQELARRCLWLNRVYTHQTEDNRTPLSPGDAELKRRLELLQKDLRAQLNEQHILRMPVQWVEGGLDSNIPEHAQYMAEVQSQLTESLSAIINTIIEEDQAKVVMKSSYGVESSLLLELVQQTHFTQRAAQCSVNRDGVLNKIKSYIMGEAASGQVLVLHGSHGCGKTTLLSRAAQCCHNWLPDSVVAVRFTGISQQSMTIEQILRTIITQCSIVSDGHTPFLRHNLETYSEVLSSTLATAALQRTVIVIIDGLDQIREFGSTSFDWLPVPVPNNVRLIISVNDDDSSATSTFSKIKVGLGAAGSYLVQMPTLEKSEAESLLLSSVMEYNHSVNSQVQDCVLASVKECTLPLYVKVLAWHTSWCCDTENEVLPRGDVEKQLTLMFDELETLLGKEQVASAMALMVSAKFGLMDSEMLDLLAHEPQFHSQTTYVVWAPACLFWAQFVKQLVPFLIWFNVGNSCALQWRDVMVRSLVRERYKSHINWAHQTLFKYFKGGLKLPNMDSVSARHLVQSNKTGRSCYNCRRLEELPYQAYQQKQNFISDYLFDQNWIYDKLCGSTVYQVLEDVHLASSSQTVAADISWLQEFLENYSPALAYDGRQLYTLLSAPSIHKSTSSQLCMRWTQTANNPPVACLTVVPSPITADSDKVEKETNNESARVFNSISRLPESPHYVVTISTEKEEISVWDIHKCMRVRTLRGIMQPISLQMIDDHRCVVLCKRELRTYDLDTGTLLTRLKGVMNQKMPYYGLHDSDHLVALSRNRMYVNLMNLTTGDLVTTFKAGEDRFLNSLLVSGNGRVLVCGDETQKPFPLLVWNLASRKLLYDLRIPHHDFLTHLAAITYEGHYVCCVTKEVDEPAPNFIVVYDLQSGTLFKKWKPGTNCVALDISSKDGCILSGHEDGRILLWDLVTGEQSAVFTPNKAVTACEITAGGEFVILATEHATQLITLQLVGPNITSKTEKGSVASYGLPEKTGKVFDLQER